MTERKV